MSRTELTIETQLEILNDQIHVTFQEAQYWQAMAISGEKKDTRTD